MLGFDGGNLVKRLCIVTVVGLLGNCTILQQDSNTKFSIVKYRIRWRASILGIIMGLSSVLGLTRFPKVLRTTKSSQTRVWVKNGSPAVTLLYLALMRMTGPFAWAWAQVSLKLAMSWY